MIRMSYNKADFLAGVAAGRAMASWPLMEQEFPFIHLICKSGDFYMTISGKNIVISWGDGSTLVPATPGLEINDYQIYHHYDTGTYECIISGDLTRIWFNASGSPTETLYNRALKEVLSPLPRTLTTAAGMFFNCRSLDYVTPNAFAFLHNVESFSAVFYGTPDLKSISEDIFARNVNAEDFTRCFYGSGLETIPGDLFRHNVKAENFYECFYNSRHTSVGSGLFYYNLLASNFEGCFRNCTSWVSGGANMFQSGGSVTSVEEFMSGCRYFTDDVPELWNLYPNASHYHAFFSCTRAANRSQIPSGWR